jgi:hypothetical protein
MNLKLRRLKEVYDKRKETGMSKSRSEIEKEVEDDLAKSPKHLLVDIHEEILKQDRPIDQNMIHAYKRFASLLTHSAIASREAADENIKLQQKIAKLTKGIWVFTIVLIIISLAVLIFK